MGLTIPALAAPALWKARDDDSAIWIFGSIHVLPDHAEWRTPLFDQTTAGADKVVFETDIGPAAMAGLCAQAFAQGIYVDGALLTDVIDVKTERKMRQSAADYAMKVRPLLAMRPWQPPPRFPAPLWRAWDGQGVEFILGELARASRLFGNRGRAVAVMTAAPGKRSPCRNPR
ncbi:MAG: TraB/GumN family protein [Candidatus Devosia euplotis]|nr:TraB/GumN family protein [Candidatus Devosia euplotis]